MPEGEASEGTRVINVEEYNLFKQAYQDQQREKQERDRIMNELRKTQEELKRSEQLRNQMVIDHNGQIERLVNAQKEEMQKEVCKMRQELGLKIIDERKVQELSGNNDKGARDKVTKLKESSLKDDALNLERENYERNSEEESKRKKTSFVKKGKQNKPLKQNMTIDNIYDQSSTSEVDSNDNDDSSVDFDYKSSDIRVITELPKVEPFNNSKQQDVHQFFNDYERYCQQRYYGRKNLWVKGLGESLGEQMLKAFQAMIADSGTNVKYESLKNRLIRQANRMKKTSHHDPRKNFDSIKMKSNESTWEYAHRLETAAIEKFGDEFIDGKDNEILKKFLDTVPENIRRAVNKQRKIRKQMGVNRYTWSDVMQDLEEENGLQAFGNGPDVMIQSAFNDSKVYSSYKDALLSSEKENEPQWQYMIKAIFQNTQKILDSRPDQRGRASAQGQRGNNKDRSQSGNRHSSSDRQVRENRSCNYCHQRGHLFEDCRVRLKLCFRCGSNDHFIGECKRKPSEGTVTGPGKPVSCQLCGKSGHTAKNCPPPVSAPAKPQRQICQFCDQEGHDAKNCSKYQASATSTGLTGNA